MSLGLRKGYKAALPFVLGASFGFSFLLLLIGLGLGMLSVKYALAFIYLQVVCALYLGYQGYRVFLSDFSDNSCDEEKTSGFIVGFLLQWLNPKAWSACMIGSAAFSVSESYSRLILFNGIYLLVCTFGIFSWAYAGSALKTIEAGKKIIPLLNKTLGAGLMVVSVILFYQGLIRL